MSYTNKTQRRLSPAIISFIVLGLLLLPSFVFGQAQEDKRITEKNLISSVRLGRSQGMTAARYIQLIEQNGVNFQLSPKTEEEIRRKGLYLGTKGLDDLIDAVRNNFRTPLKGVERTQIIAEGLRAHSSSPQFTEKVNELVKLVRELASRNYSLANGINFFLNNPSHQSETVAEINRELQEANNKLKRILEVMDQVDPGWSNRNADISINANEIFLSKERFIIVVGNELRKIDMSEAQLRALSKEFNQQGDILRNLAQDLAGTNQ